MTCGDLRQGFYVVASFSRIIRIVHVTIDDKAAIIVHCKILPIQKWAGFLMQKYQV